MARIRSIKPELPQSESMGRISREARLLFIMLWTICDDEGRARGNSRMLASLLFPYDDDVPGLIEEWLTELEHEDCIVRYEADGSTYLQIYNWLNHQKIDKPSKSKIPPFVESSRKVAKPRESSPLDQGSKDQGSKDQGSKYIGPSGDGYTPEFEAAWAMYPKRSGGNPKKEAFRAWNARIKEGETPEAMTEGLEHYRLWCEHTGKINTEFIKQGSSFFGPSKPYEESWDLPSGGPPHAPNRKPMSAIDRVRAANRGQTYDGEVID